MYQYRCARCGEFEIWRPMSLASGQPQPCIHCQAEAVRVFTVPRASIDASGEDSTDPQRQRDGTHVFNLGLPGVDTVVGKRRNGTDALEYRPISNNEIGTDRKRRDYAKRHGLVPVQTPRRAIGGRT